MVITHVLLLSFYNVSTTVSFVSTVSTTVLIVSTVSTTVSIFYRVYCSVATPGDPGVAVSRVRVGIRMLATGNTPVQQQQRYTENQGNLREIQER